VVQLRGTRGHTPRYRADAPIPAGPTPRSLPRELD
jgi:hypothetical protein